MREIKFRAWVLGKMYEVKNLEWDWGHLIITTDGGWIALPDPEAHLMEFTGLHDKNGVEIYEGDILQGTMGDETWIVKFNKGCFQVFSYGEADYCLQDFYDEVTVIGNIHENPELLGAPDA